MAVIAGVIAVCVIAGVIQLMAGVSGVLLQNMSGLKNAWGVLQVQN